MTREPPRATGPVARLDRARGAFGRGAALAWAAAAALAGPATAQAPAEQTPAAACPEHVVEPGDSLAAIAARYGVQGGAAALAALNADAAPDPDRIRPGQRLRLPCPDGAAPSAPDAAAAASAEDPSDPAASAEAQAEAGGDPAGASAPRTAALPLPRSEGPAVAAGDPAGRDAAPAPAVPSDDARSLDSRSDEGPLRAFQAPEEVPGANSEADARLAAALAAAAPERPLAETAAPGPDARPADVGGPEGRLSDYDLVYPWVRPDCDRLERLPPELAARCTRYDFSQPLATARIAWFARADAPFLSAEFPSELRGLTICRPEGMFDGDLAAAGLAPPRAARLAPTTARACLDAVAAGEADVASLEAREARRARARPPPLPDVTELPALASRVTLHAAAWRGSGAGRAALAVLDAGLAAIRDREVPAQREEGDR